MEEVLYPTLNEALLSLPDGIDLKAIIAQALHMGDECHNRNRAGTSLFLRAIAPSLIRVQKDPEDIAKVLVTAKFMMPKVPIALGCMRPKGKDRTITDTLVVKAGVDAIAFPDEEAIKLAESLGLEISFSPICCSQIFIDLAS